MEHDADAKASGLEDYRLGRSYDVMPIALVPEHCVTVPAGPITFVVEARRLTDDAIISSAEEQGRRTAIDEPSGVDDGGASLHVLGAEDGLEHLRFDCFDREPHYHYIRNADRSNVVVRLDTFAEGDPAGWVLSKVRERLPEMLGHAGALELAQSVEARRDEVLGALPEVERLLAAAS